MSDLEDGRYIILRAGNPFPVGASVEGEPIEDVISGGKSHIWTVRKLETGNYVLLLEQGGAKWISYGFKDDVVVGTMPMVTEGWAIRKQIEDTYSIEVPSAHWPTRAWTLDSDLTRFKVGLDILKLPREGQLWGFIPIPQE